MQPAKDRIGMDGIRFSAAMTRILVWVVKIGERRIRDFSRQNNFHPARCQRIIVAGRTTTNASRQLQNRESNAREIRVTGSTRRGLISRSL
jgi:hypothetical protein